MRTIIFTLAATLFASTAFAAEQAFIRVSPRDSRYLELSDGSPYIPIGLNMIAPPGSQEGMERWMKLLADNGGNYIRVWLSNPFFDVEHEKAGVYDPRKAERIDWLLATARKHDIRVKMCIEHFRHLGDGRQTWAAKPLHHRDNGGTATTMAEWFDGPASREQFKKKLSWYAARYGDDPTIFGWELWNEVDAVSGRVNYLPWSEEMLAELHRLFPEKLALQSLGSYDNERKRDTYRRHSLMRGNDIAQVHRYLDLGASWKVCGGPVDELAADAVREMLAFEPGKPVLLAEGGAVEPSHTGPFKLYAKDKEGIILHDVLFAPFLAGAAGPGHIWHWDAYVDRNNLWWHFGRFAAVVKDIDPPAERCRPLRLAHDRLKVMVLKGERTTLIWCRDRRNTWMTELRDGRRPDVIQGASINLKPLGLPAGVLVRIYDPWMDRWMGAGAAGETVELPPFSRSIVVRIERRLPINDSQ